ncbi:MAG: site-2 protease family protein [Fimbriimonadaceae bacterium]|nr:site-2 protease family protein [Fimbriimonadaceae bacterium]QYK55487.1 MAG: site-2 protease family protein [Fimbriimonadaceae bacterium]
MDPAGQILDWTGTAVVFLLMITALVAVHELGHFLVARAFGMHVEAFAVMMGGVRKTDLRSYLRKPLVPASQVWAVGLAFLGVALAGLVLKQVVLLTAGLALLGIVLPVWVATRIEALYHLPAWSSLRTLVMSWVAAALIILIGTGMRGMQPPQVVGLLGIASLVAVGLVYYAPLRNKVEDSPQGLGQIEVPVTAGDAGESETGYRTVDVQFRPVAATRDRKGTEYSLLLLPLGGFAAIKGMHPKEDGSEVGVAQGFYSKGPWPRLAVLFAGPAFSILFGIVLLAGLFAVRGEERFGEAPVLGAVTSDGPAGKAGLKAGDRVLSVDGKPVTKFYDLVEAIRGRFKETESGYSGIATELVLQREGETFSVTVTPTVNPEPLPYLTPDMELSKDKRIYAKLLVSPSIELRTVPIGEAFGKAAVYPLELVGSLAGIVQNPSTAKDSIGGPGTIAEQTSVAKKVGFHAIVLLSGLLSISLGVLNLLPIPPMDGGQMLVAFVEVFRGGRRLSLRVQNTLHTVGFMLIMALSLAAVTVDLGHYSGASKRSPMGSAPQK